MTGAGGAQPLQVRGAAARRLPAIAARHGSGLAAHDPLLPWPDSPRAPSTFGLTDDERRREAVRLLAIGWARWEVAAVLAAPKSAAP